MHKIVKTESLAPSMFLMEVEAPKIAAKRKPGQFIMLRIDETGERVPFTISDGNTETGTITIVYQVVGKTTAQMAALKPGDSILDVVGPLGKPTHMEKVGTVCCIGGGTGIAIAYPIAKGLREAGNKVLSILGARTKELLFYEDQVRSISNELLVCTDDGSYGQKGLVTEMLKQLIDRGEQLKLVVAIGPVPMMKFVAKMTKEYNIPTIVSLNPIMIDGSGMCGGCRVSVGGATKFVCVDGPEFDAHQVDFELLTKRLASYREEEAKSYDLYKHNCKLGRG
ncbi:MAG: sulfide/dihydroorotate dehydrogenase-like FAD/NAD-binding protein [Candidatus Abyssobacteria bacterium SURF_5]|uniref:Sulfide/dihydroorotate dehydrogenase-like FAD/NAD-binding protein n=1 Tax=Abyssobacteria bacterium (strain SURF_5) TaxID=2093360 RepID=A0A3A4P407_ABYX5|nr:MAG: sulfide/dihydroorotate dehydrogenase-like FAD/NAD-binding protein [Candidatus Abyssubacteria bacterium SURF_5]